MHARWIALLLLVLVVTGIRAGAQNAPAAKPISQPGLTEALRIGGLTTQELIDIIKQRGVAFALTEQAETDLRAVGATTALIEAVRANYRPPAGEARPTQSGPLSKNEVVTLLEVGTPSPRIAQIVNQRGVNFPATPAITQELTAAGADAALLAAIEASWAKSAGAVAAPPVQTVAPPASAKGKEAATPPAAPVRLTSLKEVHKLYMEKIKNNLDEYLRAELTKQLPGRFLLVLNKEEADALLVGSGSEQTGATSAITGRYLGLHDTARGAVSIVDKAGTVLWASEAGDRTLLFGPLKRGGAREVATRLVQDLKKALDAVD